LLYIKANKLKRYKYHASSYLDGLDDGLDDGSLLIGKLVIQIELQFKGMHTQLELYVVPAPLE